MENRELLKQLGHTLGLELYISPEGVCRIYFDSDAVDFELAEQGIFLIAELGYLPDRNCERFCRELLSANLLGAETAGATLGLDSAKDELILHKNLGNSLDYHEFEAELENFVKALRHWKSRILAQSLHNEGDEAHFLSEYSVRV